MTCNLSPVSVCRVASTLAVAVVGVSMCATVDA